MPPTPCGTPAGTRACCISPPRSSPTAGSEQLHLHCKDDGVGIAADNLTARIRQGILHQVPRDQLRNRPALVRQRHRRPGRPDLGGERRSGPGCVHAFDVAVAGSRESIHYLKIAEVAVSDMKKPPIRVLVADDEAEVRDAYRQILLEADMSSETAVFHNLRERLFSKSMPDPMAKARLEPKRTLRRCSAREPRPPSRRCATRSASTIPSPWYFWTCACRPDPTASGPRRASGNSIRPSKSSCARPIRTSIRAISAAWCRPEEKLSYLQKPFHPHEIRQMTISLASKWRSEHRIVKLAYFDALTGLPNREQLRNRLGSALGSAKQHQRMLAVLYLDLDNFKRVNDTLGHAVGDELLRLVAARLRSSLRSDDTVDDVPSRPLQPHRPPRRR